MPLTRAAHCIMAGNYDGFDLVDMLGQIVGVVGERRYEGSLRLDIVAPRRIDLLAKPTSG